MEEKLKQLKTYFKGDLFYDDLHKKLYATDASVYRKRPLAVAFPKSEEGIRQLINFAAVNSTSLIPRTAGTSLAGQCVGSGIVVDVSKYFTKIISVNTVKKTVTVQPGVVRDELNDYLKPHNLFFGPNTSTGNRCMIGGMVGNNSSGTTSIKYGVTRDKVLRLHTLLSNGEGAVFAEMPKERFHAKRKEKTLEGQIYSTLFEKLKHKAVQTEITAQFPKPEIHRRNTGYALDALLQNEVFAKSDKKINVCKLLCGSEGTLAFTTQVTLQLDDLPPPCTALVVPHYSNLKNCLHDVVTVMQHGLYTCEMMDDVILDCTKNNALYDSYRSFVAGNPKALLLLEVKAKTTAALKQQTGALCATLRVSGHSYAAPVLMGTAVNNALELRKAGLGLLGNMVGDQKAVACIEDTAVALTDLPQYINAFSKLMDGFGQRAVYYAHAGAGELHLRPILNLKKKEGVRYFREITTAVAKLVKQYRGSFSGEHGDGIVRAEFLELMVGKQNFELLKTVKNAFDPQNIFNPGKITDAWPMDQSLRTHPGTPAPEVATLLDFSDSGGILRLAEKCNGSGDCRKGAAAPGAMCPSYHVTKNEKDSTRGRANVLREVLLHNKGANKFDSEDLKEAFKLCLSCKACATECPSNVDIATAKAEFLYRYNKANGVARTDKVFGKSSGHNKKASKFSGLANMLLSNRVSAAILKRAAGVAPKRSLPKISTKSFSKRFQTIKNEMVEGRPNVVLFVDEFSNYLDAEIAEDAFFLLKNLGYNVEAVHHLDSARALMSKGFLEEAKWEVNKNISTLKGKVGPNTPLLGIEPSAILGFRDEYPRLANDVAAARAVSKNTFLIEEFLCAEFKKGAITVQQFTLRPKTIKIHNHCHQKALGSQKTTFEILNIPKNYSPTLIVSGCCGMAGSFGLEKDTYGLSMAIGELKLFPAVRKAPKDVVIAANGTSCRHQIKDGTGVRAEHPVTILRGALAVKPLAGSVKKMPRGYGAVTDTSKILPL